MHRLKTEEEGSVLVIVVLLIVVLLGFGALAVDAGALYQENRELQNGADAAALSIGQSCASGTTQSDCWTGFASKEDHAEFYADQNAEDGSHTAAVDLSLYSAGKATVTTSTSQAGQPPGKFGLFFAKAMGMNTGSPTAKASVVWGPPAFGSFGTLPLTISKCEYDRYVGSGGGTAEAPWTTANNGPLQTLVFHSATSKTAPKDPDSCAAQAGQDTNGDNKLSGGFGWIDGSAGCQPVIDSNGWAGADPGSSVIASCSVDAILAKLYQKVVYVPVFVDINGVGTNGQYKLKYYAAFYVASYDLGGLYKAPAGYGCPGGGADRCISGWFTTAAVADGEVDPGGPDMGVRVFALDS